MINYILKLSNRHEQIIFLYTNIWLHFKNFYGLWSWLAADSTHSSYVLKDCQCHRHSIIYNFTLQLPVVRPTSMNDYVGSTVDLIFCTILNVLYAKSSLYKMHWKIAKLMKEFILSNAIELQLFIRIIPLLQLSLDLGWCRFKRKIHAMVQP